MEIRVGCCPIPCQLTKKERPIDQTNQNRKPNSDWKKKNLEKETLQMIQERTCIRDVNHPIMGINYHWTNVHWCVADRCGWNQHDRQRWRMSIHCARELPIIQTRLNPIQPPISKLQQANANKKKKNWQNLPGKYRPTWPRYGIAGASRTAALPEILASPGRWVGANERTSQRSFSKMPTDKGWQQDNTQKNSDPLPPCKSPSPWASLHWCTTDNGDEWVLFAREKRRSSRHAWTRYNPTLFRPTTVRFVTSHNRLMSPTHKPSTPVEARKSSPELPNPRLDGPTTCGVLGKPTPGFVEFTSSQIHQATAHLGAGLFATLPCCFQGQGSEIQVTKTWDLCLPGALRAFGLLL